jgi:transcriptional regulator with XRE-family HTH domain
MTSTVTTTPIGRVIRQLREERGWSQAELATRASEHGVSVTESAISRLEGGSRLGERATLGALARAFAINPERLYFASGMQPTWLQERLSAGTFDDVERAYADLCRTFALDDDEMAAWSQ